MTKKISELVANNPASALDGTEEMELVQSATSKGGLISQIATYFRGIVNQFTAQQRFGAAPNPADANADAVFTPSAAGKEPAVFDTTSTQPAVVRQLGGAAGTNEGQLYHDGSDLVIINVHGSTDNTQIGASSRLWQLNAFVLQDSGHTLALRNSGNDRQKGLALASSGVVAWTGSSAVDGFTPDIALMRKQARGLSLSSDGTTGIGTIGGCIFDHFADAATTHTDGTEDDLYSDTVAANTLSNNGDKLKAHYALTFAAHAVSTDRVQAYFGGTKILDSGSNNFTTGGAADVWIEIIQESATVVRVSAEFVPSGINLQPVVTYTRITGLTLSATNILKTTGVATGTNSAAGDITAKEATVDWIPAA